MSKKNDEILSEIFNAAGRFILEGGAFPRLSGDPEQVRMIRRATLASRRFYETLCNESASIDAVNVMMEERRRAGDDFRRAFGCEWRF